MVDHDPTHSCKFDPRSNEGMFLGYSLKIKTNRYLNQRTKTIVECANLKLDEKFGVKEKILDYISKEEEDNPKPLIENIEIFFEANNEIFCCIREYFILDGRSKRVHKCHFVFLNHFRHKDRISFPFYLLLNSCNAFKKNF